MKLRIRSIESKETSRIEVPNTCTVQQLKQLLSSSSSSSSSPAENLVVLSLNRKDELCGPEESLRSVGVIPGDLIYFSLNPYAFSSSSQTLPLDFVNPSNEKPAGSNTRSDQNLGKMDNEGGVSIKLNSKAEDEVNAREGETLELSGQSVEPENGTLISTACKVEHRDLRGSQEKETREPYTIFESPLESEEKNIGEVITDGAEDMEIDESVIAGKTTFSVPIFLRKVLGKEVGDAANGGDHKLLAIAIHAVLLESGFMCYDPVSSMPSSEFHLPDIWPSSGFTLSLCYTLPEIVSAEDVETVALKFQTLGKFVNVYGSLPKKGFGIYRVCLDESRFVPALNFIWKNADSQGDGSMSKSYPEREVFELWKIMKDGLALPLLIDICERAGLVPPPCFMRLPTELKLNILELLPATDVVKVACVASELRFLASNNDLWKLKYTEEFGGLAGSQNEAQWKGRFCQAWENRKKRKRACVPRRRGPGFGIARFPVRRDPCPFGAPFIIGGEYDRLPGAGIPRLFGPGGMSLYSNIRGFNH